MQCESTLRYHHLKYLPSLLASWSSHALNLRWSFRRTGGKAATSEDPGSSDMVKKLR